MRNSHQGRHRKYSDSQFVNQGDEVSSTGRKKSVPLVHPLNQQEGVLILVDLLSASPLTTRSSFERINQLGKRAARRS